MSAHCLFMVAVPWCPAGFTTNPVILERDNQKCTLKNLTNMARVVSAQYVCLVRAGNAGEGASAWHAVY